jgi:hypothetical protein
MKWAHFQAVALALVLVVAGAECTATCVSTRCDTGKAPPCHNHSGSKSTVSICIDSTLVAEAGSAEINPTVPAVLSTFLLLQPMRPAFFTLLGELAIQANSPPILLSTILRV